MKKKKLDLDLTQANLLTDILRLAHLINMETEHEVSLPMGLPDKQYRQFYIKLDDTQLGKISCFDNHIAPVFLEEKEANDLLRQIRYKLIKCLEENKKYKYGGWK